MPCACAQSGQACGRERVCSSGCASSACGGCPASWVASGLCGLSTGPIHSTPSSCTCQSPGQGGVSSSSAASRPSRSGPGGCSFADRCTRRSGRSRCSRPSRGITQRASRLPEQPSTNGASLRGLARSAQVSAISAKPSLVASRRRVPAAVSTSPRPWRVNRAVPNSCSRERTCRLMAPWVTCRASAARLTLCRRAAASKARKAASGGREVGICEYRSQVAAILSIYPLRRLR